ncbi:MAG: endonuclease NucS domain-containing protein [Candidatus Bathyarchaeia archaeon]
MGKYGTPIWLHVFEAARELKSPTFAPNDIIRKVHETNPEIPAGTIRSYVIAMAPNHPSSKHHPSTRKRHGFFEYLDRGRFRLRDRMDITTEEKTTEENGEEEDTIEENLEEVQISLEGDLETFILRDLASVEDGLSQYQRDRGEQFSVDSGRIDVLAVDKEGSFVVIELKAGTATDSVLAQVLAYMADVKKTLADQKRVRGIIIAYDFSNRLTSAVSLLENVALMKYKVKFDFERVT